MPGKAGELPCQREEKRNLAGVCISVVESLHGIGKAPHSVFSLSCGCGKTWLGVMNCHEE